MKDPLWRSPAVRSVLGWIGAALAGFALTAAASINSRVSTLESRAAADDVRWQWIRERVDQIYQATTNKDPAHAPRP